MLTKHVQTFAPEAILTVAHGYSWMTAAAIARRWQLPLHLIIHDDWPSIVPDFLGIQRVVRARFANSYRRAASRLCISPYMVEEYKTRYGCDGTVVFPSPSINRPECELPTRSAYKHDKIIIGFGGNVANAGYVRALQQLAEYANELGAIVHIYGPLTQQNARRFGLLLPNVKLQGFINSNEFISRLRGECDILFLPMSFAAGDASNMRLGFPSKFADYTVAGLPILIYGPEYCSAIRWAKENPGIAETAETCRALKIALRRLVDDAQLRHRLARVATNIGEKCFSNEHSVRSFHQTLASSGPGA